MEAVFCKPSSIIIRRMGIALRVEMRKSYTSGDLVAADRRCFEYIGGIPQELIFDRDSIVTVSENYGDI